MSIRRANAMQCFWIESDPYEKIGRRNGDRKLYTGMGEWTPGSVSMIRTILVALIGEWLCCDNRGRKRAL